LICSNEPLIYSATETRKTRSQIVPDSNRDFVLGEYLLVAVDAEGFVLPEEWSAFGRFPWSEYSEILGSLDGGDMARLEVSEVETHFTLNVHAGVVAQSWWESEVALSPA
jgi:hypothetical protein